VQGVPFKFDENAFKEPTSFEFVFIATNRLKYVYGFSATSSEITREYLYVYKTSKASLVFERIQANYTFTSVYEKELKPIVPRNTSNKLFLATATTWNCTSTKEPLLWLMDGINTYNSSNPKEMLYVSGPMLEKDNNHLLKTFITEILHKADINISDYKISIEEKTQDQFLQTLPKNIKPLFSALPSGNHKRIEVETYHEVVKDGKKNVYSLDLLDESLGTINLFLLSPLINRAFETGEVVCIDEFDSSMHPLLVLYIVQLFNNPLYNKANAQLIISSHTTELLDLSIMRRDQIYFIDKNNKTGISELYSLDEYSERTRTDIRKAYLVGRYDAIPHIDY
ncbi:MAG: ATP-binding protein, partial [Sphaerochaetaceae bacterium]|nr:ATP-binding protein [Sphaerochaetaceae bacterium]